MKERNKNKIRGFTLVETLVGAAVFVLVASAIYGSYVNLFRFMNKAQYNVLAVSLGEEQMEIIRNMPYSDVGVVGSIPSGNIPYEQIFYRGGVTFKMITIVRNIDISSDGTAGGSPNDTAPNDNKLVSLTISCNECAETRELNITGQVAPMSLESSGNTGSLFVRVHDAVGANIQDANVRVINNQGTSTITINDVTDNTGTLALVGVPPGTQAYSISVTKPGYSTDMTYPLGGAGNPNPANVHANVVTGQVTATDFFIDKLARLHVSSVSPSCTAVGSYDFVMNGSKEIGINTLKYSRSHVTDVSGLLNLPTTEWDTAYTIIPSDASYDLAGSIPASPFTLNPDADVNLQLIVVPRNPKSIMVSVVDSSTGLPLSGANVRLVSGGYDKTETTGLGFMSQNDWIGGNGQVLYTDPAKYFSDDGNVDVSTVPYNIRLRNAFGVYNPSGYLESSTFDTGTSSNFYNFIWSPNNVPASTSIKFQFAVSTTSTPVSGWDFKGPDGTTSTYFTVSNTSFDVSQNNNRFARYRAFLSTDRSSSTPTISEIGFTYNSACIPPGQVLFQGLASGNYTVTISKAGYNTVVSSTTLSSNWQEIKQVLTQ